MDNYFAREFDFRVLTLDCDAECFCHKVELHYKRGWCYSTGFYMKPTSIHPDQYGFIIRDNTLCNTNPEIKVYTIVKEQKGKSPIIIGDSGCGIKYKNIMDDIGIVEARYQHPVIVEAGGTRLFFDLRFRASSPGIKFKIEEFREKLDAAKLAMEEKEKQTETNMIEAARTMNKLKEIKAFQYTWEAMDNVYSTEY